MTIRTLIVTIEDNEMAGLIVRELAIRQGLLEGEPSLIENEFAEYIRDNVHLDAMVARPTKWCDCGSTRGAGRRAAGYAQSKTYHWWVHTRRPNGKKCMRPTRYVIDHWISNMLNGARDLLGEIIPSHEEVLDHLDRGARFRVRKQDARNEVAELVRQR